MSSTLHLFVSFVVKPVLLQEAQAFFSRPFVALTHYAVSRFCERYSVMYRAFSYSLETARS